MAKEEEDEVRAWGRVGGTYWIESACGGVAAVLDGRDEKGAPIGLAGKAVANKYRKPCLWTVVKVDSSSDEGGRRTEWYHLVNVATGRVFHNHGGSKDENAAITAWDSCGGHNLQVCFEPAAGGGDGAAADAKGASYYIRFRQGLYASVNTKPAADGRCRLWQLKRRDGNDPCQRWRLVAKAGVPHVVGAMVPASSLPLDTPVYLVNAMFGTVAVVDDGRNENGAKCRLGWPADARVADHRSLATWCILSLHDEEEDGWFHIESCATRRIFHNHGGTMAPGAHVTTWANHSDGGDNLKVRFRKSNWLDDGKPSTSFFIEFKQGLFVTATAQAGQIVQQVVSPHMLRCQLWDVKPASDLRKEASSD